MIICKKARILFQDAGFLGVRFTLCDTCRGRLWLSLRGQKAVLTGASK